MGTVEKLKGLHKQDALKPSDIGRVAVAEEAGVEASEYLDRARTLSDYLGNDAAGGEEEEEEEEEDADVESE